MSHGRVIVVTSEDEWKQRIKESKTFGGKSVIVDFTATWCGPCQAIAPAFEKLSNQFTNVTFLKVDVDQLQEIAAECGVRAMPTFQGFFNGEKADELVGADPSKLEALCSKLNGLATSLGAGRTLGGSSSGSSSSAPAAPADGPEARRAMMAAAAEARLKAMQAPQ